MDLEKSLFDFFASIDFSLLQPVITAAIGLMILLKIKSVVQTFGDWITVYRDKDLRVGSVYRFSTPVGNKKGVLTKIGFKYCRFRFADHTMRVPNKDLAYGELSIVLLTPEECSEDISKNFHDEDVDIRQTDLPKRRGDDAAK